MRRPKAGNQTEHYIKQQVKRVLTDAGWTFWMPSADIYGRNGVSDFLAIKKPSLFMAIETKYRDVVTALQHEFLTAVHNAGHYAFLVDETNIEEFRALFKSDLSPHWTTANRLKSFLKWREQLAEKLDA